MKKDGWVIIEADLETKNFDAEMKDIENQLKELEKKQKVLQAYNRFKDKQKEGDVIQWTAENEEELAKYGLTLQDVGNIQTWEKLSAQVETLANKYVTLSEKQQKVKEEEEEITEETKKTGVSLDKTIKKIGRWAGALFGIRTLYGAIRNLGALVISKNEVMSAQIDTMKMAVANVLAPAVEKILSLVKTLMLYINYIAKRLTGKYIFDFTKAFNNVNKSSSSIAKNMNKTVASFDEMNVVSDNSANDGGMGAVGNPFEGWENFEPPKWLEKFTNFLEFIKTNWKTIALGVAGIAGAFLIFKLIKAKEVGNLGTSFTSFFKSVGKGIEAIAILGGFALVIKEVTKLIDTFAKSGLKVGDVLGLMGTIIGSIVVLITALTVAAQFLQSPLAMGGLLLLTGSIVAILFTMAETLPKILDAVGKFITQIAPSLNSLLETIGNNISNIIFALGVSLPPIINSVGDLFSKIFGGIANIVSTVGDTIVKVLNSVQSLISGTLSSILNFINKLGPAINNFVDNAIKALTKLINFMISGIEYMINTLVIGALRGFVSKINNLIPGSKFDLKMPSKVSIERFRPKLAKGGIINMPGQGVPVGSAIAGERGREAVLPLQDSQVLSEIADAIGKRITIDATIINSMNGRVISRELQKIQNEGNFAFNR